MVTLCRVLLSRRLLLFFCISLSLSYSSIASYRSMLSVVFRFILPELSSHFVLRDLLRSFHLERPLPSSRVPPWDLSLVLSFLRGPPFQPLSSFSLWDLTRKVLFLLSLETVLRVGELQALSAQVSSSGDDLFLSYLPEFCAKTESSVRPLPRSFLVRSLGDFVGSLPEELLLCPVRALRVSLLVLSLFLPVLVLSLSLLVLLLALSPRMLLAFSSGMLLRRRILLLVCLFLLLLLLLRQPWSSLRVHGVSDSWAFHRNAPLSSILESATWSSASVFTSFYLSDVQFSSSHGFSLGPLVAAGSVV